MFDMSKVKTPADEFMAKVGDNTFDAIAGACIPVPVDAECVTLYTFDIYTGAARRVIFEIPRRGFGDFARQFCAVWYKKQRETASVAFKALDPFRTLESIAERDMWLTVERRYNRVWEATECHMQYVKAADVNMHDIVNAFSGASDKAYSEKVRKAYSALKNALQTVPTVGNNEDTADLKNVRRAFTDFAAHVWTTSPVRANATLKPTADMTRNLYRATVKPSRIDKNGRVISGETVADRQGIAEAFRLCVEYLQTHGKRITSDSAPVDPVPVDPAPVEND